MQVSCEDQKWTTQQKAEPTARVALAGTGGRPENRPHQHRDYEPVGVRKDQGSAMAMDPQLTCVPWMSNGRFGRGAAGRLVQIGDRPALQVLR